MSKIKRQSNIELLRIICILCVIVLHYNGYAGHALELVSDGKNLIVLIVSESVSICAVNLFMLISGFFSCNVRKISVHKPIKLITQVVILSGAWYTFLSLIKGTFSIKSFFCSLIPANFFVILYICVYLLSPYLNILYEKMNTKLVILIILMFSVYPSVVDVFNQVSCRNWMGLSSIGLEGSQSGYTIVQFILMYYIGMYLKKEEQKLTMVKTPKLILALCVDVLLIATWALYSHHLGLSCLSWSYCNPIVVFEAIIVFLLFHRMNIGQVKWVNIMSGACFTCFLSHDKLIEFVNVGWAVQQSWLVLMIHIICSSLLIYFVCYLVHLSYDYIEKSFFNLMRKI